MFLAGLASRGRGRIDVEMEQHFFAKTISQWAL